MTERVDFTTENKDSTLEYQVEIDEKMFYAYKPSGQIKLHPGVQHHPKTPRQVQATHVANPCADSNHEASLAQTYWSCRALW